MTSIVARRPVLVVLAAVGVWLFVSRGPFIGLLGLAPIYLSYRAILIYAGRVDAEEAAALRAAIEGQMATLSSEVGASLLAHAGIAVFPHDGETFEALCAVAYGRATDRLRE